MKNFYFIGTFNTTSPVVKKYLEDSCLVIEQGMLVDFKFRSKLYSTYSEAVSGTEYDFNCRIEVLYDDDVQIQIKEALIVNPSFAVSPEVAKQNATEYSERIGEWEANCAAAIFFFDEEALAEPLMKYEVFFVEDAMEVPRNGDREHYILLHEEGNDKLPSMLH